MTKRILKKILFVLILFFLIFISLSLVGNTMIIVRGLPIHETPRALRIIYFIREFFVK